MTDSEVDSNENNMGPTLRGNQSKRGRGKPDRISRINKGKAKENQRLKDLSSERLLNLILLQRDRRFRSWQEVCGPTNSVQIGHALVDRLLDSSWNC